MNIVLYRLLRAGLLIGVIFLMVGAGTAYSADRGAELQMKLENGNVAFSEGKYKEAISIYNEMIREYGFSPELLHNLANSYGADGQNGKAILNYMRGLRIAPGDDDLRADLALIRKKVGLFNDEPTLLEGFSSYYNMNQWLTRALVAYILLTLLLLISSRLRLRKGVLSSTFVLAGLILVCCAGAYSQRRNWNSAVIVQPETRLLLSPFASAASNGSLIEGTLVSIEKEHQGYSYVLDEKDRSGWIPSTSFEPINTSSFTYSHEGAGR